MRTRLSHPGIVYFLFVVFVLIFKPEIHADSVTDPCSGLGFILLLFTAFTTLFPRHDIVLTSLFAIMHIWNLYSCSTTNPILMQMLNVLGLLLIIVQSFLWIINFRFLLNLLS